jgi:hypothetical protein
MVGTSEASRFVAVLSLSLSQVTVSDSSQVVSAVVSGGRQGNSLLDVGEGPCHANSWEDQASQGHKD